MTTTALPDRPSCEQPLPLLDLAGVAAICGVTPRSVENWLAKGCFPAPVKVGGGR